MDNIHNILKRTYYDTSVSNIGVFLEYLTSIAGNVLKPSCIRQNIFKTRWLERDKKLRIRCQVQAAIQYIKYLSETSSEQKEADVKTAIADLCPYIKAIDPQQKTSFILTSTNTLPSTIHYKHAEWIFYKNDLPADAKTRFGLDILSLYALRLSLEKRVLSFMGIDFVELNGKPCNFSRLIVVVKKLTQVQYHKDIAWNEVEWVNDWLNHHMHRHLRPHPWIIHQAFQILNPLLQPSKILDGPVTHHSFYASTFVVDENLFHNEVEQQILKAMPKAEITWKGTREIAKRRKTTLH